MNRGIKIRLPYLTLIIAVALVADSPIADWLVEHWDVTLSGLIVLLGATWVSTSTGLSTTGTMSVSGASTLTGTTTMVASDNLCAGMRFTAIGSAAAGKIGLSANQLALLGGSSGHGFFNSGGGLTTSVDASGNWGMTGRINSATAQPGFLAYNSANDTVGPGVTATVIFDTVVHNPGGGFAAGVFTATVPGTYLLSTGVTVTIGSINIPGHVTIVTSNRSVRWYTPPVGSLGSGANTVSAGGSVLIDMDAGDTAMVQYTNNSGGALDSVVGTGSPYVTFFSGRLVP